VDYAMNCTFTITDDGGKRVSSIPPGTYQIQITTPVVFSAVDLSGINDFTACKSFVQFQLSGPGVNVTSTLQDGDEDKDILKETFQANSTYTARDLNQPLVARAVFTTTASGSPSAPANPAAPSTSPTKPSASVDIVGSALKANPFRGTLAATVSAGQAEQWSLPCQGDRPEQAGRFCLAAGEQIGAHADETDLRWHVLTNSDDEAWAVALLPERRQEELLRRRRVVVALT
jgi:hypothetical protein